MKDFHELTLEVRKLVRAYQYIGDKLWIIYLFPQCYRVYLLFGIRNSNIEETIVRFEGKALESHFVCYFVLGLRLAPTTDVIRLSPVSITTELLALELSLASLSAVYNGHHWSASVIFSNKFETALVWFVYLPSVCFFAINYWLM